MPTNATIVPDVTGMTYERANEELAKADLLAIRVDEPNADVAVGNVIRTDPVAGTSLSPEQKVRVYVSEGQEVATMPVVVGLGAGCRGRRAAGCRPRARHDHAAERSRTSPRAP